MNGFDEFISVFGDITVMNVAWLILAIVFALGVWKKVKEYLIKKHDSETERNKQIATALTEIGKYPQYRQQSIAVQEKLESEIQELREAITRNTKVIDDITKKVSEMEENSRNLERNKLQDRLLQSYRYYTSEAHNPGRSWSKMESQAFWQLFTEYENRGGNGYMHTVVAPAMKQLRVTELDEFVE